MIRVNRQTAERLLALYAPRHPFAWFCWVRLVRQEFTK